MGNSVIVEKEVDIMMIYLNEPASLNALSYPLKEDLLDALDQAEKDPEVRVVILAAKGKAFCAGGDVKNMAKHQETPIEINQRMNQSSGIARKIRDLDKVVISVVHGSAAGAGMSLALSCDAVIAEEDSTFILSFKNVGLVPDLGLHYHLPKLVGEWKAKQWVWSGKRLTAEEAWEYGIVMEVTAKGNGVTTAKEYARTLTSEPFEALLMSKSIINDAHHLSLEGVLKRENEAQALLRTTDDHKEGLSALFEKRVPHFKGK